MDNMRSGIGLRAIGQRDPLVEYKAEGYRMYQHLIAVLEGEIASSIFKAELVTAEAQAPIETALTKAAETAEATTSGEPVKPKPNRPTGPVVGGQKVGRNDPCPCGSGLKYKKCGMINAPEHRG